MKKPVLLCIMDGFGKNPSDYGNAIVAANTPNLDKIMANNPMTFIDASGMDVGLPDGQIGNSEVGHTNIGAGRVVYQELTRITKSIKDGDFFENEALKGAMENCLKNGSALHLMGLMSDGGVHSHNTHLFAIVEMAKKYGLKEVYVHCFLDGRDVPPASGADYVAETCAKLREIGVGEVATVMGRYYAMDRDNRWDRVGKAYAAMVYGEGNKAECPVEAIKTSYETIDSEGKNTLQTNLLSRQFATKTAKLRLTTALFSSTSVLTEQEKSQEPSLTRLLTASKEETASSRFTTFV